MKRKALAVVLLLVISGMVFVGCSRDRDGTSKVTGPIVGWPGPTLNLELDDLTYETFSGTLYPGESGVLVGTSTTWGKNCIFSLVVPSSATDSLPYPINFTMRIPTKAMYFGADSTALKDWMIIRFEPDGYHFSDSLTVTGTWMPWRGAPPTPLWVYEPGGTDSTQATITPVGSPPNQRYRVTFKVNHFSDWETGPGPRNQAP